MADDSRPLHADVIPAVAEGTARRKRRIAIVLFVIASALTLLLLLPFLNPNHKWKHPDHKPYGGLVAELILLCGPLATFGLDAAFTARRARRVGKRASETTLSWYLKGRIVVAADDRGVVQPDLSLKVSRTMREMLTAVPMAKASIKEREA